MSWLKRKLVKWLLKDVDVEELTVRKLKIGDKTVTIDANSVTLPSLTADPTLAAGKVWYRSDLKLLGYSPDGTAVNRIPIGTINVDTHASRHASGGADAIPSGGIARSQLEYPTVDVAFMYLAGIGKTIYDKQETGHAHVRTVDDFADKAIEAQIAGTIHKTWGRFTNWSNFYSQELQTGEITADHLLYKTVAGTRTLLASEAVDLTADDVFLFKLSISGSTLKGYRDDMVTAKISATDTSFTTGKWGVDVFRKDTFDRITNPFWIMLRAAGSSSPPAQSILELGLEGSGKFEDPFRPSMSKSLAEIAPLTGLPDFLYQETKKYELLKAKGFTEDEMRMLLGYVPQRQVDLDSVTWGSFEIHADKAPTVIVVITGDNPYKAGAIDRQKGKAKRVFAPPKDYGEAISLYNMLRKDYPHWLDGKDNFAYQTLGLEVFDWFQNVDFYYGEFIEHKTHYSQLKQVPDFEIRNRLNELIEKLSKVSVLIDERDKHVAKAREILKRGW
jgi:hypothetical protein